ncbi:hypothetical protein PIIN_09971 [Serendipita indica DSM 11827]|uniref:Uncharacterized protein n=1 Tax=Serendipita indica (strain DSM 11827) TaxID=1109443 RepID=G4U2G3_SERID|nr:hypothetical protein PIIN_09971 [Serendipita indica DSM 11827]
MVNVSRDISNHNGTHAGNTLIALHPTIVVPDGEEKNPDWPGFVHSAYHISEGYILDTLRHAMKHGRYFKTLTRGVNSVGGSCPRCGVQHEDLHDLSQCWEPRSHEQSQSVYARATALCRQGSNEDAMQLLKDYGLYMVKNAYWMLPRCNIHDALSVDVLHTIWLGVWGKRLWPRLHGLLSAHARSLLATRVEDAPSYPDLIRITAIDKIDFGDGKKYFSILQQILPLVADLVTASEHGILRAIRLLAEISLIAQLRSQTEKRLAYGEKCLQEFHKTLQRLVDRRILKTEELNYPKMHQISHLFEDLRRKGPGIYLHTILGENFHQGMKRAYAASNFKDVIPQLLRYAHRMQLFSRISFHNKVHQELLNYQDPGDDAGLDDIDSDEATAGVPPTSEDNAMRVYSDEELNLTGAERTNKKHGLLMESAWIQLNFLDATSSNLPNVDPTLQDTDQPDTLPVCFK